MTPNDLAESAEPSTSLAAGDLLGSYEILGPLGEGGQGRVFEARHRAMGRVVALKVPLPDLATRLLDEARIAGRLDHPQIARVEHVHDVGPTPFLVMELCRGGDLEARLAEHPSGLPVAEALRIARSVADALSYAHAQGVIHGDLKPSNVVFDQRGTPKICDFGAGLAFAPDALAHTLERTRLEGKGGTPAYMAPEQADPRLLAGADLDGRADLFALGKILYRMLTGHGPQTIRAPSHVRPGLDRAFDEVVFRLTAERREDRYADAGAALAALDKLAARAGLPVGAAGDAAAQGAAGLGEAALPPQLRRFALPRLSTLTAALAALHVGGGGVLLLLAMLTAGPSPEVALCLRILGWCATLGLVPAIFLVARLRGRSATLPTLVQAWVGMSVVLVALGASLALARLAPSASLSWPSAGFVAFLLLFAGASLVGSALAASHPLPPLDGPTANYQSFVRLPTQVALFVTIAWLIGIWLNLRPVEDAPFHFGALAAITFAWRLGAREARVRSSWPRLNALFVLGAAVSFGLGWADLQLAAHAPAWSGGAVLRGLLLCGVALAVAVALPRAEVPRSG